MVVVARRPQAWVAAATARVAQNTCNAPMSTLFLGSSPENGSCCLALQQGLSWGLPPQGDRSVFPAYPQAPALLPITAPWAGFIQFWAPELLFTLGYLPSRGSQTGMGPAHGVSGACCRMLTPQFQGYSHPHPPSVLCFWSFSSTGHHHPSHETLPWNLCPSALSPCPLHHGCPGLEGHGLGFLHFHLWSHGFVLFYPRQTSS